MEPLIGPRPEVREGNYDPKTIKAFQLEELLKNYQFKNKDFSLDYGTKIKGFRQEEIDILKRGILAYTLRIPQNERNQYQWKNYIKLKYKQLKECKDKKCSEDTWSIIEARLEPNPFTLKDIENILKYIDN